MSRFDRRHDRPSSSPPRPTRIDLAGHSRIPLENATVFLAYLRPLRNSRDALPAAGNDANETEDAQTVQLRINAVDLNALLTMACDAPALTVLDELSGCFYDVFFVPTVDHQQLVACAAFSRRNLV